MKTIFFSDQHSMGKQQYVAPLTEVIRQHCLAALMAGSTQDAVDPDLGDAKQHHSSLWDDDAWNDEQTFETTTAEEFSVNWDE